MPGDPIADVERLLDQQMESSRFRGIRPMGGGMGVPPAEVLRALAERDLIFELMVASRPARVGGDRRWPTSAT